MAQRIILITGASGGLAQAIIRQLPREDYLILLGRSKDRLDSLYQAIPRKECYEIAIQDPAAIEDLVDELYQRHGRIDVLINNAGFGAFKAFDDFSAEEIEAMFRVNSLASIHFARLLGHKMAEQGSGHIINNCLHGRLNCFSEIKHLFCNKVCSHWLFQCPSLGAGRTAGLCDDC